MAITKKIPTLEEVNELIAGAKPTIPNATSTTYGTVKLGSSTIQSVSMNSASSTSGRTYPIQKNSSGQLVVNVPWASGTSGSYIPLSGSSNIAGSLIPSRSSSYSLGSQQYLWNYIWANAIWANIIVDPQGHLYLYSKAQSINSTPSSSPQATNNYLLLNNNVLICFGTYIPSGSGAQFSTINFPYAFERVPAIICTYEGGENTGNFYGFLSNSPGSTTRYFKAKCFAGNPLHWVAIGYRR